MVPLQSDFDHGTQSHVLTCFMFPQQPPADEGGSGCLRHLFYSNLVSWIDFYGGFFPFHSLPFPSLLLNLIHFSYHAFHSFSFLPSPSFNSLPPFPCLPFPLPWFSFHFLSFPFLSFPSFLSFSFSFVSLLSASFVYPTFLPFCSYSLPSISFAFLLFFFHFSSLIFFFKIGLGYIGYMPWKISFTYNSNQKCITYILQLKFTLHLLLTCMI